MFERILYPTDFSDVSKKVLDCVKELRKSGTQEVVILHVIDQKQLDFMFYDTVKSLDTEAELHRRAQEDMRPIVDELNRWGLTTKVRTETADPFREIVRIEEEEGVSLIVIGSHGKSNLEEMLLGSVSEKVVRKARGPVLVVKR